MGRIKELDALRGLAALLVVSYHCPYFYNFPRAAMVLGHLYAAVDFFFVLSGFLITGIVLNNDARSRRFFVNFYWRRTLRIWPLYYLGIALASVLGWSRIFRAGPPTGAELLSYLTFTQNVPFYWSGSAPIYPPLAHYWSLAVEEQFYLFWPALVVLAGRKGFPLLAIFVPIAAVARYRGLQHQVLLTRCDGLVLGAFLAWALADSTRVRRHLGAYRVGLGALTLAGLTFPIWGRGLFPLLETTWPGLRPRDLRGAILTTAFDFLFVGVVGLAAVFAGHPWLALLRRRELTYFGTISFGVYVYHNLIAAALRGETEAAKAWWTPATVALYFGGTIAIASLSWFLLERPILAYKDRFAYRAVADGGTSG